VSFALGILVLGLVLLCFGPPAAYDEGVPMAFNLKLGLVLLFCVLPLVALAAVTCGHAAASRIKKAPASFRGRGTARAGLIMGYFGIALFVTVCLLLVWFVLTFRIG
jgi:hypothetical protein